MLKSEKTKLHFVNVARELFAQKGRNGVTMNEIAAKSGKGRRTLYTYFNNKQEVYLAVIENELNILIDNLQGVVKANVSAPSKLENYIFVRFDLIRDAVLRNGSLKSDFFRNIYEVEKARRSIDIREIRMLRQIIDEGIVEGLFKDVSSQWAAVIIFYAIKGMEIPYLNNNISLQLKDRRKQIMNVIMNGLLI